MSWTYAAKNIASFAKRVRNLLYYFWGTHDSKYVVDHLKRKIIFFDYDYTDKDKKVATYTNINKS